MSVPTSRLSIINDAAIRPNGAFVLYWMIAARRLHRNFALEYAVERANALHVPLVVIEALRLDYPWSNQRLHQFVVEGMVDNARANQVPGVTYLAFVEPKRDAGKGLLQHLSRRACEVVTDWFPCFFLPRMQIAAASKLDVRLTKVDSNGLLPLSISARPWSRAFQFRNFMQKTLRPYLDEFPEEEPLKQLKAKQKPVFPDAHPSWRFLKTRDRDAAIGQLEELEYQYSVPPVVIRGGSRAASERLDDFLSNQLRLYMAQRLNLDQEACSGLSPWLHFGHISAHEIFLKLTKRESWSPAKLSSPKGGKREGFWNMSPEAEGFLEELITWRELGYAFCEAEPYYDQFRSLPDWAKTTIQEHTDDLRTQVYDLETFARAETHDPTWNTAQRQLLKEGRIHNYMRMLWGKKILEWTPDAQTALDVMIELNNRYAIDGRNPNSYSGIMWVLGRFDRAWGPERPVYGKLRYMTSEQAVKKTACKAYLQRFGPPRTSQLF